MSNEDRSSEWIDVLTSWYKFDDIKEKEYKELKDKSKKEIENLLDEAKNGVVCLTKQVTEVRNELKQVQSELRDILSINIDLKNEISSLSRLNKELREELMEIRGLNEREKNLYVRSRVPFRFTPDSHRLFPFGVGVDLLKK